MQNEERVDAREALGEAFARDLWVSWQEHGAKAIDAVRVDKPDLYVKLVTAMLPKEMGTRTGEPDELDDAALDRRIAALATALGLAIGPRPGAGGQGPAAGKEPAGEI